MSIFIRHERFGTSPKILRLRGIWCCLGEDNIGVVTYQNPKVRYFSLGLIKERYILMVECEGLKINEQACEAGSQHWLAQGDRIQVNDSLFIIVPTSTLAEGLAYSDAKISSYENIEYLSDDFPNISYGLSQFEQRLALYPNIEFIVGTHNDCSMQIIIEGVTDRHCSFTYCIGTGVTVRPLSGQVKIDDRTLSEPTILSNNQLIRLEPVGLEIALEFP